MSSVYYTMTLAIQFPATKKYLLDFVTSENYVKVEQIYSILTLFKKS